MVHSQRFDGITPEMYEWYSQNVAELCTKVNDLQKMVVLEQKGNHQLVHMQVKIPAPFVENRSMVQDMWSEYNPEGKSIYYSTTEGNEDKLAQYKDKIPAKDVICSALGYTSIEGTNKNAAGEFTAVKATLLISIDIAGSMPDMVKEKVSSNFQFETLEKVMDFIKKHYKEK